MNPEKADRGKEMSPDAAVSLPPVESFLRPSHLNGVWPERVATDAAFVEQCRARAELDRRLGDVFGNLPRPDMPIAHAFERGFVEREGIERLYGSLCEFLESDPHHRRIVLYLPFELLSEIPSSANDGLRNISKRFRTAYLKAWKELLAVHDVRANFVDGDVLETEKRDFDPPRVVKAAHLIPKLVENGLLGVGDIIAIMEGSDDRVLRDSIADTFPVMADLGFVSDEEIGMMTGSADRLIGNLGRIMASERAMADEYPGRQEDIAVTCDGIRRSIRDEFAHIEAEPHDDATPRRIAWLRQQKKRDAIASAGRRIASAILHDGLAPDMISEFIRTDTDTRQALIEGIRGAIESAFSDGTGKPDELFARYGNALLSLWETDEPILGESLSIALCRLRRLGVVDDRFLDRLGIVVPKLVGPLSENLKSMGGELSEARNMVASIESDPALSGFLLPAVLVFGSRLKGYGAQGADIDVGVFVRPDVSENDRPRMQESMRGAFPQEKIRGDAVEFWLEEKSGNLRVRESDRRDVTLGARSWTHVLFGAAWEGNADVIRDLRERLLVPYLYDTGETIHGRDARSVYLEEMERDALLYRLAHRGYERFNPPFGGVHTAHSDDIDGESAFWDSGYRQVATRLFVERVFLPKLSAFVR
ncbi:MAG TPA: hypothetical protein VN420_02890 [Candidatus Fimivivens sp.]|nr:hypothetical protein [Candidatus Fimivivens sp.]